jgi:hypothetical protein
VALITIATIQCDSTIAVQVVKDFLVARGVDIGAISTAPQAKAALETELRTFIKETAKTRRAQVDGDNAITASLATNDTAIALS